MGVREGCWGRDGPTEAGEVPVEALFTAEESGEAGDEVEGASARNGAVELERRATPRNSVKRRAKWAVAPVLAAIKVIADDV